MYEKCHKKPKKRVLSVSIIEFAFNKVEIIYYRARPIFSDNDNDDDNQHNILLLQVYFLYAYVVQQPW